MIRVILILVCLNAALSLNINSNHLQTNNDPYLPVYVGKGYNIILGNPLHSQKLDPGFRKQIFDLSYSNQNKTSDRKFIVPNSDQIEANQVTTCSLKSTIFQYRGVQSYQNSLTLKATASVSYKGLIASGSFSVSTTYKQMKNETVQNKNIVTHAIAECERYRLLMGLHVIPPFSADFLEGVKQSLASNNWEAFVNSYGTHYIYDVVMGGRAYSETIYTFESVSKLSSLGIDINVAAKVSFAQFHGDTTVDYSNVKNQSKYAEQYEDSSKQVYIGGKPPTNGKVIEWLDSVTNDSMPISYKLNTISSLFSKINGINANDAKNQYESYLEKYCNNQGCSKPIPDCSLPSPSKFTNKVYGPYPLSSSHKAIIAHTKGKKRRPPPPPPPPPVIAKFDSKFDSVLNAMDRLYIQQGATLSRIQLRITDGVRSLITGYFGYDNRSPQLTWDVPMGESISQFSIWTGTMVNSIQFITNTGKISPKYGTDPAGKQTLVTLAKNQRIIGLKGVTQDNKIKTLGFTISVSTASPYCA